MAFRWIYIVALFKTRAQKQAMSTLSLSIVDPRLPLYHKTPCLRSLTSRVSRCIPLPSSPKQPARWSVVLQNTIMYPEGGGQPGDTGSITCLPISGCQQQVRVLDTQWSEAGSEIIHITDKPVPLDKPVSVAVDWARRFDHMQQHSGEHLLSAVLEGMLAAPTDSWKLQPLQPHSTTMSFVSVDAMVPSLTAEQLAQAEEQCNAHIRAARSVRQVVVDEADQVQQEALIAKDIFTGSWPSGPAMHGLPRLIEIEGVDLHACGGTHVSCTSELQVLKVLGWEKHKGQARVHFIAGGRVTAALGSALSREACLNKVLSCAPSDHVAHVEGLLAAKQASSRVSRVLSEELAALQGKQLASQSQAQGGAAMFVRPESDLQYLSLVAKAAHEVEPRSVLLLLAPQSAASSECAFLVSGPSGPVTQAGRQVALILGGKGGGKSGRYQGKGTDYSAEKAREAFEVVLALNKPACQSDVSS